MLKAYARVLLWAGIDDDELASGWLSVGLVSTRRSWCKLHCHDMVLPALS